MSVTIYDMKNNSKLAVGPPPGRNPLSDQQRHPGPGQAGAAVRARVRQHRGHASRRELLQARREQRVRHGCAGESVELGVSQVPADRERGRFAAAACRRVGGVGGGDLAICWASATRAATFGEVVRATPSRAAASSSRLASSRPGRARDARPRHAGDTPWRRPRLSPGHC